MSNNNENSNIESTESTTVESTESVNIEVKTEATVEPEVKENKIVEETKKIKDDLHNYLYPYSEVKPKDKESLEPYGKLSLPTASEEENINYLAKVSEFKDKDFKGYFNTDTFRSFLTTHLYSIPKGMLDKYIPNKEDLVNDVNYANKNLNLRHINFATKEKVSNAAAVARLTSIFNIGEIVQVPLWNSGFWVTIVPPSQRDLVNLEIQLAREELELGRTTSNFVYSHYSVIFVKILANFIVKNIKEHTLTLPVGENILDYIKMSDLYPLILGLLASIYPDGMDVNVFCNNRMEFKEDGTPKCDFTTVVKTDPRKLLNVDKGKLTDKMLSQMTTRTPNSVSLDSVINYQSLLESSYQHIEIDSTVGMKIHVEFKNPSISDSIRIGEEWIGEVIKTLEEVFVKADGNESKNEMINTAVDMSILTVYSNYVKSISIPSENLYIDSYASILETLERFSGDNVIVKGFVDAIDKYISRSAISLVGIPSFTCPKCQEINGNKDNTEFKEFIPIEVIKYFFENLKLRINNQRAMVNS